ncbi:MAG TPA: hypothetical protein VHL58_12205 [Thermoanaerobaculia bacterium]|nr:hypothetical protein [Thermoanaerobaculia bacterium]
MNRALSTYLTQRPESSPFVLSVDLERSLAELFKNPDWILPRPYKIFYSDESLAPTLGFPVSATEGLRDLESKLDRWLAEEVRWQADRSQNKERLQQAFSTYVSLVMKLAENAMLSNLLADYHGVFWLAHSVDLSRHITGIPRRLSIIDTNVGRTQGDTLKYRIFSKWSLEMREQMSQLTARLAPALDGEEERGLRFFRLLQENVLILTEEFIGPDLRELRSFFQGYIHRDFLAFKESFDRLFATVAELIKRDPTFRGAVTLLGVNPERGLPLGLVFDSRFQKFIFEHLVVEELMTREEREQLSSLSRRLQEYSILHQLRRAIIWMTTTPNGDILPVEKGPGVSYSRATRPIDFARPGVVDPMVYRFGLMYDITAFSETLGNLARAGRKPEISSYRQMVYFQRKVGSIADRHVLQFEKFLGDGAFYTTRRALRLVFAAVEIQRFYSEMRRKGFAFNKGLRLALNFGYYRLLPMKGTPDSPEHVMEFYGPGIIELSRLTTGKANKEIEEIQGFLVAHGYDSATVHQFFAPLARGVDVVDRETHQREYYAYVNQNGHLVNEGIVASLLLLQELSTELTVNPRPLFRLRASWGNYIGFSSTLEGIDFIGFRLLGVVSLKGLEKIEVTEIVRFRRDDVRTEPIEEEEPLYNLVRQQYHQPDGGPSAKLDDETSATVSGGDAELMLCSADPDSDATSYIIVGEWDARTDEVRKSVQLDNFDLDLVGLVLPLTAESLESSREKLREFYRTTRSLQPCTDIPLGHIRQRSNFLAFFIGRTIEGL